MNARQSLTITAILFGLAISAAYAQNDTVIAQQNTQGQQTSTDASTTTTQATPTTFHIGETWQEHLQKEQAKEAAEANGQQNQGQ